MRYHETTKSPVGWLAGCRPVAIPANEEAHMGKTGRKRRARRKKSANHGKRPNA